jgi:hypothetical protein
MDLHLERGAVILLSPDKFVHKDKDGKIRPGISASKRHDVSISGEGIIDGNGAWWRPVKRSKVSDVEWNKYKKVIGGVEKDGGICHRMKARMPSVLIQGGKNYGSTTQHYSYERTETAWYHNRKSGKVI